MPRGYAITVLRARIAQHGNFEASLRVKARLQGSCEPEGVSVAASG